jgi:K+-transporting ATPase ATPase C chain
MKNLLLPSIRAVLTLMLLTGIVYPFLMTGLAQIIFPFQANGSRIFRNGNVVGSELIGQNSQSDRYFWSRPSAIDYNPMPSGASNLGPTSKALRDSVRERRNRFLAQNHLPFDTVIPVEMLSASASGVDPHITPEAALLQLQRVADARRFDSTKTAALRLLIEQMIEAPQLNLLGQQRVNVLKLNLALDDMH